MCHEGLSCRLSGKPRVKTTAVPDTATVTVTNVTVTSRKAVQDGIGPSEDDLLTV